MELGRSRVCSSPGEEAIKVKVKVKEVEGGDGISELPRGGWLCALSSEVKMNDRDQNQSVVSVSVQIPSVVVGRK